MALRDKDRPPAIREPGHPPPVKEPPAAERDEPASTPDDHDSSHPEPDTPDDGQLPPSRSAQR